MSESVKSNESSLYQLHSFPVVIAKLFPMETADFEFRFVDEQNELKVVRVHKQLLSIMSPVFAAMFGANWNTRDRIEVKDASFATFKEFIQVFYKNEVDITEENVGELLNLAKKYQIDDLVPDCVEVLVKNLTLDNCIDALNLATAFDIDELNKECEELITDDAKAIMTSDAFKVCSFNALKAILVLEKLNCTEHELFGSAIEWAKHQCVEKAIDPTDANNLRNELGNCLDKIRFNEMAQAEVISCIDSYGAMFPKEQIIGFLKHFSESGFVVNGRQKQCASDSE